MDGINSWSIQTLLRGENDSKQSDEIQAKSKYEYDKMQLCCWLRLSFIASLLCAVDAFRVTWSVSFGYVTEMH